jgi:hypothetical protein
MHILTGKLLVNRKIWYVYKSCATAQQEQPARNMKELAGGAS